LAAILSLGMMYNHFGRPELEARILKAVQETLLADQITPELGGTLSTSAVTDAVLGRLG